MCTWRTNLSYSSYSNQWTEGKDIRLIWWFKCRYYPPSVTCHHDTDGSLNGQRGQEEQLQIPQTVNIYMTMGVVFKAHLKKKSEITILFWVQSCRLLMSRLIEVCCEPEGDHIRHTLMWKKKKHFHLGSPVSCSLTFIVYLLLISFLGHPLPLQPQLLLLDLKSLPVLLLLLLYPALLLPLLLALLLHLQHTHTNNFMSQMYILCFS